MIFYIIVLICLTLYKSQLYTNGSFNSQYLSKYDTNSIKGLFMLLIFSRHFISYVSLKGIYDTAFLSFDSFLGQLIVVVFLFYSGYGIQESIKFKPHYVKSIPYKRIFSTWLRFAFAILLFCFMNFLLHKTFPLKTTILAFTSWTSIGNSNWYVFAILYCYFITWICFSLFSKKHIPALILITFLSGVYMLVLHHIRPNQGWWYNTIFCYAAGMWYSYFKSYFENFIKSKQINYFSVLLINVLFLFAARPYRYHLFIYQLWALCFAAIVLLLSMKFSIHNNFLNWIGVHTFEIYILQRIPMIIFHSLKISKYSYLFFIISFISLFPLAVLFNKLTTVLFTSKKVSQND